MVLLSLYPSTFVCGESLLLVLMGGSLTRSGQADLRALCDSTLNTEIEFTIHTEIKLAISTEKNDTKYNEIRDEDR